MKSEELIINDNKIHEKKDEVIISFGPFNDLDQIHHVDEMLYNYIPKEVGNYDGHEVNMDDTDGRLFAYGKNAEELFKMMMPILKKFDFLQKAYVSLRFYKENGNYTELEFKLNQV